MAFSLRTTMTWLMNLHPAAAVSLAAAPAMVISFSPQPSPAPFYSGSHQSVAAADHLMYVTCLSSVRIRGG